MAGTMNAEASVQSGVQRRQQTTWSEEYQRKCMSAALV